MLRDALLLAVALSTSTTVVLGGQPPARGSSARTPPDELLWQEICRLDRQPAEPGQYELRLARLRESRQALLEKVRQYLTTYPGGPRRDAAVRIELRTLFDLGTLAGGDYELLCRRVDDYLQRPPSRAALHEAAYWAIYCARLGTRAPASAPASAPFGLLDPQLLGAYREYITRYPDSRHVPRMATVLFDAAAQRHDLEQMRELVGRLERSFPEHLATATLRARLRRREAVGRPFVFSFESPEYGKVDTARWRGEPVLIVAWASFCPAARECVSQVEALRAAHRELHVVGVNLDASPERMRAACAELGLDWPQFNDRRGWANSFVLQWGVRRIPWVFVIDRAGRLVGSGGTDEWRELAERTLAN